MTHIPKSSMCSACDHALEIEACAKLDFTKMPRFNPNEVKHYLPKVAVICTEFKRAEK